MARISEITNSFSFSFHLLKKTCLSIDDVCLFFTKRKYYGPHIYIATLGDVADAWRPISIL